MPDGQSAFCLAHWRALTPAQQSALTRLLMRQADAARTRAIGEALLAAMRPSLGRKARSEVSSCC